MRSYLFKIRRERSIVAESHAVQALNQLPVKLDRGIVSYTGAFYPHPVRDKAGFMNGSYLDV